MEGFKYVLIERFLEEIREAIQKNKLQYIPRGENEEWLLKLGFTVKNVEQTVMALTPEDYYDGPRDDINDKYKGTVWIFTKSICGNPIYIKIKLQEFKNGRKIAKCLSFHKMNLTTRGNREEVNEL